VALGLARQPAVNVLDGVSDDDSWHDFPQSLSYMADFAATLTWRSAPE
jgi:hypothetical protein